MKLKLLNFLLAATLFFGTISAAELPTPEQQLERALLLKASVGPDYYRPEEQQKIRDAEALYRAIIVRSEQLEPVSLAVLNRARMHLADIVRLAAFAGTQGKNVPEALSLYRDIIICHEADQKTLSTQELNQVYYKFAQLIENDLVFKTQITQATFDDVATLYKNIINQAEENSENVDTVTLMESRYNLACFLRHNKISDVKYPNNLFLAELLCRQVHEAAGAAFPRTAAMALTMINDMQPLLAQIAREQAHRIRVKHLNEAILLKPVVEHPDRV